MPDHPASDPPKPGSKLADMHALPRARLLRSADEPGIIRRAATKVAALMTPRQPRPAPPPPDVDPLAKFMKHGRAAQEAANAEIARVKTLPPEERKVVAQTAIADAVQKAKTKPKKVGRPSSGQPWVKLGISKRTYYRRKEKGEL